MAVPIPVETQRISKYPRVTFGIIVLNGEPFTRYKLRALYPFAHEIIVVEGASVKAAGVATSDGHSTDGTLDVLKHFKAEEDLENKVTIVTAEDERRPNGFWPGDKDEQSQAYAKRATGDYLWQVDIDEFYKPDDISAILEMLCNDPAIAQVNVPQLNLWGGFEYLVDGLFLRQFYRAMGGGVPRVFRWGPGYRYVKHRPPTVVDDSGVDLRKGTWLTGFQLARMGIYCYHYATVFPEPVGWRMEYYSRQNWRGHEQLKDWYQSNFMRIQHPFRVHHVAGRISWLKRFSRSHPTHVQLLISDLEGGRIAATRRDISDIEHLLSSRRYLLGTLCFQLLTPALLKLQFLLPRVGGLIESSIERLFSPSMT